jgi:hypothetical protein
MFLHSLGNVYQLQTKNSGHKECCHGYKLNFISLKLPENTGIKLDFGQEVDFAGSTPLI